MSSSSDSSRRSWKEELNARLASLRHLDHSGQILSDRIVLKAHSEYCDVSIGRWIKEGTVIYQVAIKRLRINILKDRDFAKVS